MPKGKKTKSEKLWQTHLYLPEVTRKKLEQIAARESRSMTQQIAHYVRLAVEEEKLA